MASIIRCLACFVLASTASTFAQQSTIKFQLVDGRTGKPMEGNRLLIFLGSSPDKVSFHEFHTEARTGKDGIAEALLDLDKAKWVQVFVDWHHLCQKTPNYKSFEVEKINHEGLQTQNNCGPIRSKPQPGILTIYARPDSVREKLAY